MRLGMQLASRWEAISGGLRGAKDSSALMNPSIPGGREKRKRGGARVANPRFLHYWSAFPIRPRCKQRPLLLFVQFSVRSDSWQIVGGTAGRPRKAATCFKTINEWKNFSRLGIMATCHYSKITAFQDHPHEPDTVGFIKPHDAKIRPRYLGSGVH
jgi:hypothetical protein